MFDESIPRAFAGAFLIILASAAGLRAGDGPAAQGATGEKVVLRELRAASIMLKSGEGRGAADRLAIAARALAELKESKSLPEARLGELADEYALLEAKIEKATGGGTGRKAVPVEGIKVEGVVVGEGRRAAIVNGRVVKEGETIEGGHKVVKIERTRITFLAGGKLVVVPVENAAGGAKPRAGGRSKGGEVVVEAILVGGGRRKAIINGRLVAEGEEVSPGVKILKIERGKVTLDVNGEKVVKQR